MVINKKGKEAMRIKMMISCLVLTMPLWVVNVSRGNMVSGDGILFAQATVSDTGGDVVVGVDLLAVKDKAKEIQKKDSKKGFWKSTGSAIAGAFNSTGRAIKNNPIKSALGALALYRVGDNNQWWGGNSGNENAQTGNDAGAVRLENITITGTLVISINKGGDVHISQVTSGSQTRFDSDNVGCDKDVDVDCAGGQ